MQTFDTVVVGGGLLGKTAALALAQSGLSVALLAEPAAAVLPEQGFPSFDTRVYALSSSSHALLEKLRVWQALDRARLTPVLDMRVFGDGFAQLHFSAYQAAVPQLAWIVEAGHLERALDLALRFQPGVAWITQRAQQLVIEDEAAVLTLDNGVPLRAQLIVGADGAHSWVRLQMGARANPRGNHLLNVRQRDYQQTAIVANFRATRAHGETAYQWFSRGEIIALLPLPGQHVSLVWSAEASHAQALLSLDRTQLAAQLEHVIHREAGNPLGELECVSAARGFPLYLQQVDRLIAPRIALVGDAAHTIHPLAGQGMNLGMRDVAVLVETLAQREAFRSLADEVVLRRYERARRVDIDKLVAVTDGLQRLFAAPGTLAQRARNTGLAFVAAQPLLKRWLVGHALG